MNLDPRMPAPSPVCGADDTEVLPVAAPGRGPEVLALLQVAADMLDEVPGAMHQLGSHQEDELVSVLLRLHGRSAQVATLVTCDAVRRGAVAESDAANTGQWLAGHLTGGVPVEPKTVRVMAVVADACRAPRNTVVATALRDGNCSVESARTALAQADKVAPVIPTADRDEILGWFLQVDPSLGGAGLTQLTRRIIARFAPDELSDHDQKIEATESLSWSTTPTGMTRLVAELSPGNAAILQDAITAKSAPGPAKPSGTLGGSVFGLGATTTTGDVIDAGAARRLACTADLIPAVLGGPSQPLDVGRRERLATKAIRAAAILRDRGCSFPGCDRPPGFCEIHHIQPWWTGGETSLANSALLCGRHHQIVHRQGYTAHVHPDSVQWDLTPGRLPGHHTTAA